jgi:hypothetical protein
MDCSVKTECFCSSVWNSTTTATTTQQQQQQRISRNEYSRTEILLHALSLSHPLSHTHVHTLFFSLSSSLPHIHAHTPFSLSLSFPSHPRAHTQTHFLSFSLSSYLPRTHSLSHSHNVSLSITHTRTHIAAAVNARPVISFLLVVLLDGSKPRNIPLKIQTKKLRFGNGNE